MEVLAILIAGLAAGVFIGWLVTRGNAMAARATAQQEREARERAEAACAELNSRVAEVQEARARAEAMLSEAEKRIAEERELLSQAEDKLKDTFNALAGEALAQSSKSFLELANERLNTITAAATGDAEARKVAIETMVKPLGESLMAMNQQVQAMERSRSQAYGALENQVRSLVTTEGELRSETANLVKALRTPQVRGRWGEIQLKRVVELAGMVDRCDFYTQESVTTSNGRLRPDLRIQLPGGRSIIVDAKTPLLAYLEAVEAPSDAIRQAKLKEHARQVRDHMKALETKAYWEQFEPTPQFVVMFLPGESFFSAALEQDSSLIETGGDRVVLATPTTLIALLRAVAYGWMQQETAENADKIRMLGRDLYERLATMLESFTNMGANLGRAVDAFNRGVGSFETRVVPAARRFKELGISSDKEIAISQVETMPHHIQDALALGESSSLKTT